mmetsp:Transcript_132677/g.369907  ORF Transcript_132677/g.369907 Transcript_132677/m.369907 type:complete len:85 (-) Transcript_132677:1276-1530(-)
MALGKLPCVAVLEEVAVVVEVAVLVGSSGWKGSGAMATDLTLTPPRPAGPWTPRNTVVEFRMRALKAGAYRRPAKALTEEPWGT